jgi:ubiquinone/menaquinone biosynthesis C-methylase UbiE
MAHRVCPAWVGYFLLLPLRKLFENPDKILKPLVREGMTVLESGCGMGFFTLALARLVGASGKVIAVDIQPRMLSALSRRVQKAGLSERVEPRQAEAESLGIGDLTGRIDLVVAIHVVHEMPSAGHFFTEIWGALKPGGKVLVIEPKWHVSYENFKQTAAAAADAGFSVDEEFSDAKARKLLLAKPA